MSERIFVLIHSPLVGPLTWSLVADELGRRGNDVLVPSLAVGEDQEDPFWQGHARAVARALGTRRQLPLLLVAHSGAGPLLPAISDQLGRSVATYLAVDAGLPVDGASRLDLLEEEDPALADELRRLLGDGGLFPTWTEGDLRELIPDPSRRRGLIAELYPRPLSFWTEPIPVFEGWPDAPGGYLQLSDAYNAAGARARNLGWAYSRMEVGHFHMLVDPAGITEALLQLADLADPRSQGGSG